MKNNRRLFIGQSAFALFGTLPFSSYLFSETGMSGINYNNKEQELEEVWTRYPSTHLDEVNAVVGASHSDIDRVRDLVLKRPELAKATYDWGFGDVESALGAASHMGRRDIAEFLMEHGARPNLFTLTMLGQNEAVKTMIRAVPGIERIHGPHGLTLLFHAQMPVRRKLLEGAELEKQNELIEYLQSLEGTDIKETSLDITPEEQKAFIGKYTFGEGVNDFFEVVLNSREMLFLKRGDYTGRVLKRVEEFAFAPGGAPTVRVRFEINQGMANKLIVHDPAPIVIATRV